MTRTFLSSSAPKPVSEWKAPVAALLLALCLISGTLSAQTVTTIHTFDGTDGSPTIFGLIENTGGNFYGTTEWGGADNSGSVFEITPQGTLTTLYSFCGEVSGCGRIPEAALVRGTDGYLYGTTSDDGGTCAGTVFKITPQGTLTTLYGFCTQQTTGGGPQATMVQAQDGNFYGTTSATGYDLGTLFRITPQGQLTTIYKFCELPNCADGSFPAGSGLLLAADGRLYGLTGEGGAYTRGTVFRSTLAGSETAIHSFCANTYCTDGYAPMALVQAIDGTIYGVTYEGGQYLNCGNGVPAGCGTVFKITTTGKFSVVHSFCQQLINGFSCADGAFPSSLVLGSDGNLYGTTRSGGVPVNGGLAFGTLFRMTPDGTLTTLYSFCTQANCPDGKTPDNLVQSTDGSFYGATESDPGTIFNLGAGLPPFIETLPRYGRAGTLVTIRGNKLSSASSVSFNGTPASFDVLSHTAIRTSVPAGATTGTVTVVTDNGTISSKVVFRVVP